jgi:hypothetical protein
MKTAINPPEERVADLHAMSTFNRIIWFSAIVLTPIVLYVGSYYAFVEAAPMRQMTGQGPWQRVPHYRLGDWSASVYSPILSLDRQFFPQRCLWTDKDSARYFSRYEKASP